MSPMKNPIFYESHGQHSLSRIEDHLLWDSPWEENSFFASKEMSFASIIEIGPLGHWVNIIRPMSHAGPLSTLYQVN